MDDSILHAKSHLFWRHVKPFMALDACWIWTSKLKRGYGEWWVTTDGVRRGYRAHRVAYVLLVGDLDPGLDLDHLCRNPACVNPDHLEPVTRSVNLRRGISGHHLKRKVIDGVPTCVNGHAVVGSNARPRRNGTYLACLQCERDGARRFKERRSAA